MNQYLLLGYGISNKSISKFFDKKRIAYDIYDDNMTKYQKIKEINKYDCIVKSGSIRNDHWIIKEAIKEKVLIVSDLELFYKFSPKRKIIVITGTNGKSTTCTLLSLITGFIVAGNIGKPLFDYVETNENIIIEVSSYMSEYILDFHADYYGLLNLYPNHLNHHFTFAEYKNSKMNLFKNITDNDFLFYNYDNHNVVEEVDCKKGIKVPFSISDIISDIVSDGESVIKVFGEEIIALNELSNSLLPFLENVLLTIKMAMVLNVNKEKIRNVLINYRNLKHRIDYLFDYRNISFYNDSKATNLYALRKACEVFNDKRLLLICGGKDCYIDYDILNKVAARKIIVNGENREYLERFFNEKKIEVYKYPTLKEALNDLDKYLDNIDVVLLSPGFQSFDQFKNFEERGEFFETYLKKLYF